MKIADIAVQANVDQPKEALKQGLGPLAEKMEPHCKPVSLHVACNIFL